MSDTPTQCTGGRCPVHIFQGIPCPLCGEAKSSAPLASARTEPQDHRWMVVRKRDTDAPEVWIFDRYDVAAMHWDSVQANWTEVYFCRVAYGPKGAGMAGERPTVPAASARTVTRYWESDEGLVPNTNGKWVKFEEVEHLLSALDFQQGRADKWATVAEQQGAELSDVKAALAEQDEIVHRQSVVIAKQGVTLLENEDTIVALTARAEAAEADWNRVADENDRVIDRNNALHAQLQAAEGTIATLRETLEGIRWKPIVYCGGCGIRYRTCVQCRTGVKLIGNLGDDPTQQCGGHRNEPCAPMCAIALALRAVPAPVEGK